MVLVDSSIWIDYFRNGTDNKLDKLISEDLGVTNEVIKTELLPALSLQHKNILVESFNSIEVVPLQIDWQLIRRYQQEKLKNGINKVGIPDLLIIQQVIEMNLHLYTLDKHFELMNRHLHFNLFH